MCRYTERILR